ncbi:MAG: hypothetical protein NTV92_05280 [Candidatus Bipolaricaulota bacterium]|nr:hypothetical protein [Candidatus Bipolaricaulota bacterium]
MTEGKQQLLDPRGAGARDPKCVLGTIKRDGDRLLFEGDGGVGQFVLFPEPLAEEQPRGLEGERVSLHLTPLVRLIYQLGPIDPPITCYLPAPIDLKDLERMHEGSEEIAAGCRISSARG